MSNSPAPQRIEVESGLTVTLTWDDESVSTFTAAELRAACPCAGCREPAGEQATRLIVGGLEPVTIDTAALVGGYAINFVFGPDGHGTGIYPFAELRGLDGRGDEA
jgi:DUF971 family protein